MMKKENSHSQPIQDDALCQDPDHSNRVYFAKNKWLTVHYFFYMYLIWQMIPCQNKHICSTELVSGS